MTLMSGVGVCRRAAAMAVRSRPLGVVENGLATRTRLALHFPPHRSKQAAAREAAAV